MFSALAMRPGGTAARSATARPILQLARKVWIIGGKAAHGRAASPSQMGRFETRWLTVKKNLSALADLSGRWIDLVHGRRPPKGIVLDMNSSVSPTHSEQENRAWNGHY